MIGNANREAIAAYILESFYLTRVAAACVYRTATKDHAAQAFMDLLTAEGMTHTDCGVPLSKSGVRWAMREIN